MTNVATQETPVQRSELERRFDPHAVSIAHRQYLQPNDRTLDDMFHRVAEWVAGAEPKEKRTEAHDAFYALMASKRFCPGGRVLAGAGSDHGNGLNCFVQDESPADPGTTAGVLHLAKKLALVTKVGGGNGVNLDALAPKRPFTDTLADVLVTIRPDHADLDNVRRGRYLDLTRGEYLQVGYGEDANSPRPPGVTRFVDHAVVAAAADLTIRVPDSVGGIWHAAAEMVHAMLEKRGPIVLDLSDLRPEGTPVRGSGGTSSGPASFAIEIFDNFARWARLGGADHAGPVATLRYVYGPTLASIRQGGVRRGAGMATLDVTHPDIHDFITSKDLEREKAEGAISTFNISVLVGDAFMAHATDNDNGSGDGAALLREIAEHAWGTGEPGLIYIDRVNQFNPMRAHLGDIRTTNPCLTGDTRILTAAGPRTFAELADDGGDVLVPTFDPRTRTTRLSTMRSPRKTRDDAPIVRVTFDSGLVVRGTPDHHLFTIKGRKVELQHLEPGDRVQAFHAPAVLTHLANRAHLRQQASQYANHVVVSVEPDGHEDVYNGTVEHTHNYLVLDPDSGGETGYAGIVSANCGEIPLFPGEPCDLGAMNLAHYVHGKNGQAAFDHDGLARDVRTAVRFLDDVLDVNVFALDQNRDMSQSLRRLGLGVMGLADTLIKLGVSYDSPEGRKAVAAIMDTLRDTAVAASEELARERGAFPAYPHAHGIEERRNLAVLTVAPTGTTSMLMGASSGIEPVFSAVSYRRIGTDHVRIVHPLLEELLADHAPTPTFTAPDGAWDLDALATAIAEHDGAIQPLVANGELPDDPRLRAFRTAGELAPEAHVLMQGEIQRAFDRDSMAGNSLSKTINMPNRATVEDVLGAYTLAFRIGAKGITVYRDGSRDLQVLSTKDPNAGKNGSTDGDQDASTAGDGEAPSAPAAARAPAKARPASAAADPYKRTTRMTGFTDQAHLQDSHGHKRGFFVTVNSDEGGTPREVFLVSGKAGDEANADSEALGRVISIALQHDVPLGALIKTLRGINGGLYGTYQNRIVTSKADMIAVALGTASDTPDQPRHTDATTCPDCGTPLQFVEGCARCEACGYSRCS